MSANESFPGAELNRSPPRFHAETVVAALRAGKHVYVEKPPAATVEEARGIADMAVLLASDHADAVIGACWDANGGLYMR
ncbi:Gfo/Idh/MocA family oxidoreductase [Streptomyces sp. NPDC088124]|uniref:Gfo/Idh/MocA family oxidoreductase n=1 Tax=Streptomyces sp. NPDC088124 TaxID=3154654 RepID=UPI003417EBFD